MSYWFNSLQWMLWDLGILKFLFGWLELFLLFLLSCFFNDFLKLCISLKLCFILPVCGEISIFRNRKILMFHRKDIFFRALYWAKPKELFFQNMFLIRGIQLMESLRRWGTYWYLSSTAGRRNKESSNSIIVQENVLLLRHIFLLPLWSLNY